MQQPPQNVYTFSIHKVLCCAQKRLLTTCVCCSKHFENREPSAHIIPIKFAPKISATAYGKMTINSNAANSTGTGTNDIPAFGFTFLESMRFCGCALQRVLI